MYQLPTTKRTHEGFVAFDNSSACTRDSQRVVIVLTVRKLGTKENAVVSELVERMHGAAALGRRRSDAYGQLEYMKYIIVYKHNSDTKKRKGAALRHSVARPRARRPRRGTGAS